MLFRVNAIVSFMLFSTVVQNPAQESLQNLGRAITYENRNQIDPKPLKINALKGVVVDEKGISVPGVKIGLFAELDHVLYLTAEADQKGEFTFNQISPGRYRMVVKSLGYCPANVPVQVGIGHGFSNRAIRVHMKVGGIDVCSFGSFR